MSLHADALLFLLSRNGSVVDDDPVTLHLSSSLHCLTFFVFEEQNRRAAASHDRINGSTHGPGNASNSALHRFREASVTIHRASC